MVANVSLLFSATSSSQSMTASRSKKIEKGQPTFTFQRADYMIKLCSRHITKEALRAYRQRLCRSSQAATMEFTRQP